jgi:phosphate transport system substrate-binding protein
MRRLFVVTIAAVTLCVGPLVSAWPASASAPTAQIDGSGSSWAANAVNQWVSDVTANGLQVVFTASGSAQGRTDFRNVTTDFGVSDIGFLGVDQATGLSDTSCTDPNIKSTCRPYAYLPIVAGGTSFPYQIRVGGQRVQNLRLSGATLAKIFTNQITNWDDPQITADNNGSKLPSLPIIPVVHSEGSGSTAQFTGYLDTQYPSIWRPFAGAAGETEYFPRKGNQIAQNGSDGVINFVTSAAANGSIGYDEYSYAKAKGWPVANLENQAGWFTAPDQYNVAVALTKAQINTDPTSPNYLLQTLNNVYTNPDKRAYAMSSYSYMIIPTSSTDQRMTTPKRQALANFIDWSICGGQAEMGPIGYSPLPINLVEASFTQMNKLHTADHGVQLGNENVTTCHNPTFVAGHPSENFLAQIAPEPPACAQAGKGPCGAGAGIVTGNPQGGRAPSPSAGTSSSPATSGSRSPSAGASASTTTGASGVPGGSTGTGTGSNNNGNGSLLGSPTNIAASNSSNTNNAVLGALAAVELVLILAIPPIIARRRMQLRSKRDK